jgi:hypothetical protein
MSLMGRYRQFIKRGSSHLAAALVLLGTTIASLNQLTFARSSAARVGGRSVPVSVSSRSRVHRQQPLLHRGRPRINSATLNGGERGAVLRQ